MLRPPRRFVPALMMLAALGACAPAPTLKPEYGRPRPGSNWGLFRVPSRAMWPDVRPAFRARNAGLLEALERSLKWHDIASTQKFFPMGDVTHLRSQTSLWALRKILVEAENAERFELMLADAFDCYSSWGWNGWGDMLYTGYYSPVFRASRQATPEFQYPIYRRPPDLVTDPKTGAVLGRRTGGGLAPGYPTRREIEEGRLLDGLELVYVPSRMDQYIIHVNGSAKLEMTDGSVIYIGYDGTNGHTYTGLGHTLLKEGVFPPEGLNLPNIKRHFAARPNELNRYIMQNDRFVFFREYDGRNWPAGSLGFKVTALRSLATDKEIFPRGGPLLVNTLLTGAGRAPLSQVMFDQDTGGGIRAPGRGDIYMGVGPEAETVAGGQFAEGRLFYFFLKHERTLEWVDRMRAETAAAAPPPAAGPRRAAPAASPPALKGLDDLPPPK